MKLFKVSALVLIAAIVFADCSFFSKNDPEAQKAVQTAMINMTNVKSANYEFVMDGKIETGKDDSAGFKNLTGFLNLSGAYDTGKKADPKFSIKLSGKGIADGGEEKSLEGEMRVLDGNFYFVLSKISDFENPQYKQMLEPFTNKWWYISLPPEALSSFGMYSGDESELTPQEKQLKDLYDKTMFFKDVQLEGEESVGGVSADKYSVTFDKDVFKNYLVEASKISGQDPNENELSQIDKFLKAVDFSGYVWVGKDNKLPIKLAGKLNIKDKEESDTEMNFDVTYTVDNLGGAVTIETPKDAKEFDPLALLGGVAPAM